MKLNVPTVALFFGILASAILSTSCSTVPSGPVAITKVNPYHLKRGERVKTEDPMIKFEQLRHFHGAVDGKAMSERWGHYFSINWKTDQKQSPHTVRLEYRQAETGPIVHLQDQQVTSPKSKNVTKFEVVDDEYASKGVVTQWKATILRDGAAVAEYKSFLWK